MKPYALVIFTLIALSVSLETASAERLDSERPNVVVIFIDDMGFADPGCFGNPLIRTPNIDTLAAEGIKLTNFYVNSPICSASRVALTTGQYQGRFPITFTTCTFRFPEVPTNSNLFPTILTFATSSLSSKRWTSRSGVSSRQLMN